VEILRQERGCWRGIGSPFRRCAEVVWAHDQPASLGCSGRFLWPVIDMCAPSMTSLLLLTSFSPVRTLSKPWGRKLARNCLDWTASLVSLSLIVMALLSVAWEVGACGGGEDSAYV
jgi:hypothetical protein